MTEYDAVIWRPDLAAMRMVQGRWVMDAQRHSVHIMPSGYDYSGIAQWRLRVTSGYHPETRV